MMPLLALVEKDLRIHGLNVALYCVGFSLGARALLWTLPPTTPAGAQPLLAFPLVMYFVLVCVGWLVDRERSRETFAFLRALPVSDLHIVGSKFTAYLAMQTFGVAIALTISPIANHQLTAPQVTTTFAGVLTFAFLMLALRLVFVDKWRAALPLILLMGSALALSRLVRSGPGLAEVVRLWHEPGAHVVVWIGAVAVNGLLVWATYLRFRSKDTHELVG